VWSSKNRTADGFDLAGGISHRRRHFPVRPEGGIGAATTRCLFHFTHKESPVNLRIVASITSGVGVAAWETQPCLGFRFLRPFLTRSIALRRSSGVNFSHRVFASCDAAGFFGGAFFFGPQRARAAVLISSLRSSDDTSDHRFSAPFRPPALCRLLADFFGRKPKV